jgi:ABC-2 type transport system permease protein
LSVASRSGIVGVLGPVVIATVMLLLSLAGGGEAARALMIVNAFDAWHGLFADPAYLGPVLEAAIASVVYVVGCLGAAWAILLRRDFAGEERRALPRGAIAAAAGVVALLAIAEVATPSGITAARLESSANTSFANLASLQQQLLGRLVPRGLSLPSRAHCRRRGGRAGTTGPGGDWGCSIVIAIPPPHVDTVDVHYDVTVRPNGCYTASGPETFLGQRLLPGRNGTVNPLFEFDGCFDTS